MAEGAQIKIHNKCTLRDIGSRLLDLQSALSVIEPIMDKLGLELKAEMCLECELKKMANVMVMLKAVQDERIQVQMANGRGFELTEDKIRYYTEMLDADLLVFLKQVIIAYT